MLISNCLYRNAIIKAPGFISMSICLSKDKMKMNVITLWDGWSSAYNFKNKFRRRYNNALQSYLQRTGTYTEVKTDTLPDHNNIKLDKVANRLTVEEANKQLTDLYTSMYEVMDNRLMSPLDGLNYVELESNIDHEDAINDDEDESNVAGTGAP
jgi:poly(A) polymerase Pap1